MQIRNYWRNLASADWVMLVTFLTLVAFGLAAIYSVELSSEASEFLNVKKQLVALGVGLAAFLLIASSNHKLLRNYSAVIYVAGMLLMVGVLILGIKVRGTTGWFDFGIVRFQPVEFMKVAVAVALASYFSQRARRELRWREFFESGAIVMVPAGLTYLQPDFGSAMLMVGMWLVVIFFAGIRKRFILILVLAFTVLALLGWNFVLVDYQKARLTTFLHPEIDPLGQGYNITQATIAVGSGGWFGSGLGFGSQSQLKFLPESQTDFIFAVVAEELGFFGVSLLLVAFALLFFRMYLLASKTKDDFTSFLVIAIGGLLFVQFLVNVGMNLGMMPVTGVTLPLVSYGGSSLLFTLIMLGIVESAAIRARISTT
ncbi:rod shape-determining protein RodA [Patescibacteria group bacterium]|nr:rod shape-determining protein RodA [Patescibacteria group bacterium]MBU1705691.1 rod shape-determining protein RodA [Patescibacteria group bacterium]